MNKSLYRQSQGSRGVFTVVITFVLSVAMLLCAADARAQLFNLEQYPAMEELELIPEADFIVQTKLVEETPFGDDSLSYEVRLPNTWESKVKAPVESLGIQSEKSLIGTVANFVSPPKEQRRSSFSLEAISLQYDMPARYWFTQYVLAQGYALERVNIISEKRIEALYVEVEGDNTYVIRMMAQANGNRMMIARFKVPMPHYQEAKQLQAQVLQSFKLVKPNNERVEKLKTYGFLSESYFDYPETWSLLPSKIRTIERMQAKLALGQNLQRLDGQMGFFLSANDTNKTTLKKEVRDFKESFKVNDYKLSDFIERVEIDYNEEMDFGATEVYRMEPTISSKIEYELWVTILQNFHGRLWSLLTL